MVISMIFDLATLTVTVIAFTSGATAQIQNGQVHVYNLPDCSPESFAFTINGSLAGSAENNCNAFCSGLTQNDLLSPNGNLSMVIFNTNEDPSINQTTCYFFDTVSHPDFTCGPPLSYYNYQRSDQGCQVIPRNSTFQTGGFKFTHLPPNIVMSCYTGAC